MLTHHLRAAARALVAGFLLVGSAVGAPTVLADDDDDGTEDAQDENSDGLEVAVGVFPAGSVEPLDTPKAIG